MLGTRLKILIGYGLLAIMLLTATWLTYDNTRSLSQVNRVSEGLVVRRSIVDSLVCSMLATANAERSILLGNLDEWQSFDNALATSKKTISRLRGLVADSAGCQRLDTLMALLDAKRANTLLVMNEIGKDHIGAFYDSKVSALDSGRDSVVIHPRTADNKKREEKVYEIVRNRRGFFRRLGDVFRRQRSDTVARTEMALSASADTITHDIDIADSLANILRQIRREEQRADGKRHDAMAHRTRKLQMVSVTLAHRTGHLLADIQAQEQAALKRTVDGAVAARQKTIMRIAVFSLLAIATAAILLIYILRDIRRERADRERLSEAKAETDRLMLQRERLLLTITHDIKAPAASIAGFADLLAGYVSRSKAIAYLDNISGSARHLQRLVSALLDYHQLTDGKAELHMESFSPLRLVVSTIGEMQPLAEERGLVLRAELMTKDNNTYRSDAFRIKQILTNLVSNAIKYTDNGEVVVTMDIKLGVMYISVRDTGRGMTADEQRRIFDAFTRLPNAQGCEGVGLGLSITHELVGALGGSISVSSVKGKGSTFMLSIPMHTCSTIDAGEPARSSIVVENNTACCQSGGRSNKKDDMPKGENVVRVVALDDDGLQLKLLSEMFARLEGACFELRTTSSVREALTMLDEVKPQVFLTDIEMPEMNGSDILYLVRGRDMKVVAMTAHESNIAPRLHSEGFDACLFKPFSVDCLAATMNRFVDVLVRSMQTDVFAPLFAFADGDIEAERQIMADVRQSIDEYLSLLTNNNGNRESMAKAAHKAMPLLEMLHPGQNEWLRPITPDHIGDISDEECREIARRLIAELKALR